MVHWPPTQSHLCSSCFQLSGYCKVICESSAPRQLLAASADEEGFEGLAIRASDDSAIPASYWEAIFPSRREGAISSSGWCASDGRAGGSRFCLGYSRARHYAQLRNTPENRPSLPHHRLECLDLFCVMRKVSATSPLFFSSQRYMETEEQRIPCISINWIILTQSKMLLKFEGEKKFILRCEMQTKKSGIWGFFSHKTKRTQTRNGWLPSVNICKTCTTTWTYCWLFFFHIHLRTCMEMESRFGTLCDTSCARHRHYLGLSREQQTHVQVFHLMLS